MRGVTLSAEFFYFRFKQSTFFLLIEFKIPHLCHFSAEKYQIARFAIVIVHLYALLTALLPLPSFNCALL